jgi:high-affinity nickel-transport protein
MGGQWDLSLTRLWGVRELPVFLDPDSDRRGIALLYGILGAVNLGAWGWALFEFGRDPVLLGTAFLAYGFGLRHAVDADHIVAIDNVTRKLLGRGRGALGVGFFFSLGHSSVVVLASMAISIATNVYQLRVESIHRLGGVVGPLISAGFLFIVAVANLGTFWSVFTRFRREGDGIESSTVGGGFLARLFQPVFAVVSRSWHMYPVGILFGLGFDTATEVGVLGISAAESARGLSVGSMLVFPALFTAGMCLIDTTDSLLMLKAYGWALSSPFRRLRYNMAVTLVSALVALLIAGLEILALIGDRKGLPIPANFQFGAIGYAIVAMFLLMWGAAALFERLGRHGEQLDTPTSS